MGHLWRPYIGALFCTLLSIAAVAQDGTPVFRTTSELVLLDVRKRLVNGSSQNVGEDSIVVSWTRP